MTYFHALLLSLIEGITEFLPISSTGHLILASRLLSIPPTEFTKTFQIVIQLGAILAVCGMYAKTLIGKPSHIGRIAIAFVPTGIVGFVLYPWIKSFLLENTLITAAALFAGGIVLLFIDKNPVRAQATLITELTISRLLLIGLFQSLSIIPGVSRAAATILGGLLVGLSREDAVIFSFLLAIPTMFAASGWDLLQSYELITPDQGTLLALGFISSFITALLSVRFFLEYIKNHSLALFGWYRIAIAVGFLLVIR